MKITNQSKGCKRFTSLLGLALLGGAALAPLARGAMPLSGQRGKPRTPQAKLASKTSFGAIATSNAGVVHALDVKNLGAALKLVGKTATFKGTVVKVFAPRSNAVVLLNFATAYQTAIVGSVSSAAFARFPDLRALKGRRVLISGKVIIFKGGPELQLQTPAQIKLIR